MAFVPRYKGYKQNDVPAVRFSQSKYYQQPDLTFHLQFIKARVFRYGKVFDVRAYHRIARFQQCQFSAELVPLLGINACYTIYKR